MAQIFTFSNMPRLIFGPGARNRLGEEAARFGRRALLVTGVGSLERSGHLDEIRTDLRRSGIAVVRRTIAGEPSPAMVDEAVDNTRDAGVEVVLAVGGGSVLDAGKAIAAMLREDGSVIDYLEGVGTRRPSGRILPLIAVPTTAGTGSEATKNAVISQVGIDGFKKSLRHDNFIPLLAIVDPTLCAMASPAVTAACGMDALTQLIESYVSTQASPLTDALAMAGMSAMIPALPRACTTGAHDIDCRGDVAYGAFLSGVTLAHAGLGVVHGVAGPMGGLVSIPHGVACANLLPCAVKATIENLQRDGSPSSCAALEKFARIGRIFGASAKAPLDCCHHLVDRLFQWRAQLNIPRLGGLGLKLSHVQRLVPMAANKNNPLPLGSGQIERMVLECR